jgi:Rab-GTPase-TBC domain
MSRSTLSKNGREALSRMVVRSGFLSINDFVRMHYLLRLPCAIGLVLSSCGLEMNSRFSTWVKLLAMNPNETKSTSASAESSRPSSPRSRALAADKIKQNYLWNVDLNSAENSTNSAVGVLGEIDRDVVRTFQTHPFFKHGRKGSVMLSRILRALVSECPDVGYCQVGKVLWLCVTTCVNMDVFDAILNFAESNCRSLSACGLMIHRE